MSIWPFLTAINSGIAFVEVRLHKPQVTQYIHIYTYYEGNYQ